MVSQTVLVQGVPVPILLYGTAWKEERTAALTRQALNAGFRGIDTANQRRHYFEAAVGEAVQEALASGRIHRGDLFLQTKFTYVNGQDHRLPYDPKAEVEEQVEQSFESSLQHFGVETLDAYLLHGPSTAFGFTEQDWRTWRAMERLQTAGRVRLIGISNVTLEQLRVLADGATRKPALVQNRTFTRPHADQGVRSFCAEHGIGYEGFSLLTAHRGLLQHPAIVRAATKAGLTPAQAVLRSCLDRGMIVLTGTTSNEHMRQDLEILDAALDPEDLGVLDALLG